MEKKTPQELLAQVGWYAVWMEITRRSEDDFENEYHHGLIRLYEAQTLDEAAEALANLQQAHDRLGTQLVDLGNRLLLARQFAGEAETDRAD